MLTLPERTDDAPAISDSGAGLRLGWRGVGNEKLNVIELRLRMEVPARRDLEVVPVVPGSKFQYPTPAASTAGWITYEPAAWKEVLAETSDAAPAMVGQAIFWRGSGNTALNMAVVGPGGVQQKAVLPARSELSPAAARFRDGYLMAWTEEDSEEVNVAFVNDAGQLVSRWTLAGATSESAPAIAVQGGVIPWVAWKGPGNDHMNVARVLVQQTSPTFVGSGPTTTLTDDECDPDTGPTLAATAERLALGWKGSGNEYVNLRLRDKTGVWGPTYVSAETTTRAPSLHWISVFPEGRRQGHPVLVVSWKGSGNENINLGIADLNF